MKKALGHGARLSTAQFASGLMRLLRRLHPDHLRIARSAITISMFVLLGKIAGALKETAIAYRYGVGPVVDAYQLTFTLVTWLPGTAVNVLGTVLVPTLVRMRSRVGETLALFIGELLCWSMAVGMLVATILALLWSPAVSFMGKGLSAQTIGMSHEMMFGMLPIGALMLAICVQAARLQSRERHVNTLLECVPASVLFAAVLVFGRNGAIVPLIFGTTVGFVLQALWLAYLAKRADCVKPELHFSFQSLEWRSLMQSGGVFMLGQIAMSCVTPIDQFFVAKLGDGQIGTLGYANRVLALLLGMGALAISRATLPVFSDIRARGDQSRARQIALKWAAVMFAVALVVAVGANLIANNVIAFLFQHGKFTEENTIAVAAIFRWGLIQIPFYFAVLVMVQLLASNGKFKQMAIIAVGNFCVKLLMDVLLVDPMGARGIMLATAVMHAFSLACYTAIAMKENYKPAKS